MGSIPRSAHTQVEGSILSWEAHEKAPNCFSLTLMSLSLSSLLPLSLKAMKKMFLGENENNTKNNLGWGVLMLINQVGLNWAHRPYPGPPEPLLHSQCPRPMWPHPAGGSWGCEPGLEQWRFSVSVRHSAGPLSLQPGCQISTTQKTQEDLEQVISASILRC